MKMKPQFEQILVKKIEEDKEKMSKGGIYYPQKEKNYMIGEVMSFGPEVNDSLKEEVAVGDIIIYQQSNPVKIKKDGVEHQLVHQKNVLSTYEEEENK